MQYSHKMRSDICHNENKTSVEVSTVQPRFRNTSKSENMAAKNRHVYNRVKKTYTIKVGHRFRLKPIFSF